MRIVFLFESVQGLWGGVLRALDTADRLARRGHEVTVVSLDGPPVTSLQHAEFRAVHAFDAKSVPSADLLVATYWTTVQPALECGRGPVAHLCQGYEPLYLPCAEHRELARRAYDLGARPIVIAPHLAELVKERHGSDPIEVGYAFDPSMVRPGALRERPKGARVRIGLVGPLDVAWKGLATGYEACALAQQAGLPLELVRVSNLVPSEGERSLDVPIEWHVKVAPSSMADIYADLDLMLATSVGPEEGFFLPAMEALAAGVPLVATDVPCFRGYAPERNDYALFAGAGDAREMAEAVVLLASHQPLREQLRTAGLEVSERYRPEAFVDRIETAFDQAVHGTHSPQLQSVTPSELIDRGRELYASGDLHAAATALEHAIRDHDSDADAWNDLGVVRFGLGDSGGARLAFEAALRRAPAHADAQANLTSLADV